MYWVVLFSSIFIIKHKNCDVIYLVPQQSIKVSCGSCSCCLTCWQKQFWLQFKRRSTLHIVGNNFVDDGILRNIYHRDNFLVKILLKAISDCLTNVAWRNHDSFLCNLQQADCFTFLSSSKYFLALIACESASQQRQSKTRQISVGAISFCCIIGYTERTGLVALGLDEISECTNADNVT